MPKLKPRPITDELIYDVACSDGNFHIGRHSDHWLEKYDFSLDNLVNFVYFTAETKKISLFRRGWFCEYRMVYA